MSRERVNQALRRRWILTRAYREKRACNAILSVKTSKSLLLLRIALSVINYCYGIRRVNGN